jgi:hypothetical protein
MTRLHLTRLHRTVFALAALWCGVAGSCAWAADQAIPSSSEVCSFVAAAYNQGTESKLWGYPDPVDIAGDGILRHVYIFEEGTAHVSNIIASTKALTSDEQEAAAANSEVNFHFTKDEGIDYDSVPNVFAFQNRYYVAFEENNELIAVVKPDTGVACHFKPHYAPALSENHAPALCQALRSGKSFKKLATKPLADQIVVDDAATLDLPGPHSPVIKRYADVKLDPSGSPVRVGYFRYDSSAGTGCRAAGVVLLTGQDIEKSPRNDALLAAEGDMTDCRDSNGFLVAAAGENLIEIEGGKEGQRGTPPRVLARLRGDHVETVCKVDQKATYTPTAP